MGLAFSSRAEGSSSPYKEYPAPPEVKNFVKSVGRAKALELCGVFSDPDTFYMDEEELADYLYSGMVDIKGVHFPDDFAQRLEEFDRFPLYYTLVYKLREKEYSPRLRFALIQTPFRLPLDDPQAARAFSKEEVEAALSRAAGMEVRLPGHVAPRAYLFNSAKSFPWELQTEVPWSAFGARGLPGKGFLGEETLAFHEGLYYLVKPVYYRGERDSGAAPESLSRVVPSVSLPGSPFPKAAVCSEKGCKIVTPPPLCRHETEKISLGGHLATLPVWKCSFGEKFDTPSLRSYKKVKLAEKKDILRHNVWSRGLGLVKTDEVSRRLRLQMFYTPEPRELPIWDRVYNQEETANLVPPMEEVKGDLFQLRRKYPFGRWKIDFPPDFLRQSEEALCRLEEDLQQLLNAYTGNSRSFDINRAIRKKEKAWHKNIEVARSVARLVDSAPPTPGPLVLFRGIWDSMEFLRKNLRKSRNEKRKNLYELEVGDTHHEYGFASKSYWTEASLNFVRGSCCLLELHYPAGHKVLHLPDFTTHRFTEYEYLTRPGESFVVTDIKYEVRPDLSPVKILVMEYVPPEQEKTALELVEEMSPDLDSYESSEEDLREKEDIFRQASEGDPYSLSEFFEGIGVNFDSGYRSDEK